MSTLWKYPCGCIGLGGPKPPVLDEAGPEWHGVIRVSDCREGDWELPYVMTSPMAGYNDGVKPVPMPEESEAAYRQFLNNLAKDAQSWRALKSAVKDLNS